MLCRQQGIAHLLVQELLSLFREKVPAKVPIKWFLDVNGPHHGHCFSEPRMLACEALPKPWKLPVDPLTDLSILTRSLSVCSHAL